MTDEAWKVPLDGLGMDVKAMLDLVNRLNKHTTLKWTIDMNPSYGSGQAVNVIQNQYITQYSNPLL